MADTLSDKLKADFQKILNQSHKNQAQFFLNAYWAEHGDCAEVIWGHWQKIIEMDKQQFKALVTAGKATGDWVEQTASALDEFWSHKYLEVIGKTLSVVEFRKEFAAIDTNFDKKMGLLEFLLWEYKRSPKECLSRPQGSTDPAAIAELEKAQKLLDEVSAAFNAAEATKNDAIAAENELKAALAALKEQEDAYSKKTEELKAKAEGAGVAAMRAKNELAQHLGEDPLPLRKAKLTTEAATKKAEKARKAAEDAAEAAAKKLQEAEEYLNTVKARAGGETRGTYWWLDREIQERKKFMPKTGKAKLLF
jgi:septal ring factor EnvC (AmiA/AmiB activator)